MDRDLLKESVDNAITRGDVELLLVLWKANQGNNKIIAKIENSVPEIARVNFLYAPVGMSFKDFVMNVYDVAEARKAYNSASPRQTSRITMRRS